ncbi:hypothetical protein LguiA_004984 [Lonicera macranthoides]
MAMAIAFLILLVAAPAVTAVQYVVGDDVGWSTTGNYGAWAAGKIFNVGDTLVFNYNSNFHSVDEVTQDFFTTCMTGDALNSYTGGFNIVALNKPGPKYFVCPTPGHCALMKLAINVVDPKKTPPPPVDDNPTSGLPGGVFPNIPKGDPLNPLYKSSGSALSMNNWLIFVFPLVLGLVLGVMR